VLNSLNNACVCNACSLFSPIKLLEDIFTDLGIEDVVWVPTRNKNYYQIYFPCDLYDNDATLQYLQSKGIGTKPDTSVGYIPFSLFYCNENADSELLDDGSFGYYLQFMKQISFI